MDYIHVSVVQLNIKIRSHKHYYNAVLLCYYHLGTTFYTGRMNDTLFNSGNQF